MMGSETQPRALAVVCDARGVVRKVLLSRGRDLQEPQPGSPLSRVADADSEEKLGNMISTAMSDDLSVNWQLDLRLPDRLETLNFAAVRAGDSVIVVGARLLDDLLLLLGDLGDQRSSFDTGEAPDALLARFADAVTRYDGIAQSESEIYDELTGLYNDMSSLQRELAKKTVQLREMNRLKNQFVGMAAHDLRNPLGNILNLAEFISEPDSTDAERLEFAETIRGLSASMLNLVDDLLDLTQIEAGRVNLRTELVDLNELAESCAAQMGTLSRSIDVGVEAIHPDSATKIEADRPKLAQVVDNLVDNAVGHSPAGSMVRIVVSRASENGAEIRVEDSGDGIPQEQLSDLFVPFHGGPTSGRRHKSRGLGLAIVKRLVEAHGGEISVESEPGMGTTFLVTLPDRVPS